MLGFWYSDTGDLWSLATGATSNARLTCGNERSLDFRLRSYPGLRGYRRQPEILGFAATGIHGLLWVTGDNVRSWNF